MKTNFVSRGGKAQARPTPFLVIPYAERAAA
jgi:hypothetical protein